MMAFFSNTDYDVRTLGDGTKFIETTIDLPTPEQEASAQDDSGGDRSAERNR